MMQTKIIAKGRTLDPSSQNHANICEKKCFWTCCALPHKNLIPRAHICHRYHGLYPWRRKLPRGGISAFYTEFEQFMEFYGIFGRFCSKSMWKKICAEKISVEKK